MPPPLAADIAIGAYKSFSPIGNVNALFPIFVTGPSIKLFAELELHVEPCSNVKEPLPEISISPLVKVAEHEVVKGSFT